MTDNPCQNLSEDNSYIHALIVKKQFDFDSRWISSNKCL